MGSDNVLFASADNPAKNAALEYDVDLSENGEIALGILPTQDVNPTRGLRIALQLDDADIKVIDARQGLHDEFGEYTPGNLAMSKSLKALPEPSGLLLSGWMNGRRLIRRDEVFDNMRWLKAKFDTTPGRHKLRVIMVDPEIVLQQIVVNPDNNHYSYFGANKSTK